MYRTLLLMAVCLSSSIQSTGHGQVNRPATLPPAASPAAASPAAASPAAASPTSKSLAEMFELALRSNPEVVQAEATVRQAEADLNQVRLKVMQEVITAYHEGRKQRELLGYYEEEAANFRKRFEVGQATQGEGNQAFRQLAATRASLAQTEARLLYILGTGYGKKSVEGPKSVTPIGPAAAMPPMVAPGLPPPRIPEEFVAFLDAPIDVFWDEGDTLEAVFDFLRESTDVNFLVDEAIELDAPFQTSLELSELTVRKVLLALVDKFEGICFVFRDYGVFVTSRENAATLRSRTIPPREELPPPVGGADWWRLRIPPTYSP